MMTRKSRIAAVLIFLVFAGVAADAPGDSILLRLPFRFAPGSVAPENWTVQELQLTVNGERVRPDSLQKHSRSLGEGRGKNQILLFFHGGGPGERLRPFLDLFTRQVLHEGDQLVLCSPLSCRTVPPPTAPDAPFPEEAFQWLSEDLETFSGMLEGLEKTLTRLVEELPKAPGSTRWEKQFNRCRREVERMRQHHLASLLHRLNEGLNRLKPGNSPPWLILFGESRSLDDRLSFLPDSLRSTLSPQKQTALGDLADQLMLARASLIPLLLSDQAPGTGSVDDLSFLSRRCGIEPRPFRDPAAAISHISSFQDRSYEILFPFDGLSAEKNLRLVHTGGLEIAHPLRLQEEILRSLSGQAPARALALERLEVVGEEMVMRIVGLPLGGEAGRIRVRVTIRDESRRLRFDQEKELGARQAEMNIRIPFPADIKGYYGLTVQIFDPDSPRRVEKTIYGKR